jgi:hypothetical protein
VGSAPLPTLCSIPSTFLWDRLWLNRLNPYVILRDQESEWRYKGVLKGFSYAIDPRPPFFLTENSPTLWPVPTTLGRFHSMLFSPSNQDPLLSQEWPRWVAPLEGGREAPTQLALVCCREYCAGTSWVAGLPRPALCQRIRVLR